jgi:hypothetical protein
MRIDEFNSHKINEKNEIDYNDIKDVVMEMQEKYYKYSPEEYGFVRGEYDGETAWIISADIPNDTMKILVGDNYTDDDASKCLNNPSLYSDSVKEIYCGEWEEYNSFDDWCHYDYKFYNGNIELSDRQILNELSFAVSDEPRDAEEYNSIPNEIYNDYVNKYSEIFTYTFPYKHLEFLGASGKHVCVKEEDFEFTDWLLYPQMVACVEELQNRMIEDLEKEYGNR